MTLARPHRMDATSSRRHWRRRLIATAAGLGAAVVLAAAALVAAGVLANAAPADVAVVLGNTVAPDGRPSPRLAARLDRAYDCHAAARCRVLFVSGGIDRAGRDEAAVMRDYLIARGVPANRVVADSLGNDTWATAAHASAYMREHGYASATAITQYFHVPRTMLALRRHGVPRVGGAAPRFIEARDLYSILRELPAIAWYAIRPL